MAAGGVGDGNRQGRSVFQVGMGRIGLSANTRGVGGIPGKKTFTVIPCAGILLPLFQALGLRAFGVV
jgi:hypothetical protein